MKTETRRRDSVYQVAEEEPRNKKKRRSNFDPLLLVFVVVEEEEEEGGGGGGDGIPRHLIRWDRVSLALFSRHERLKRIKKYERKGEEKKIGGLQRAISSSFSSPLSSLGFISCLILCFKSLGCRLIGGGWRLSERTRSCHTDTHSTTERSFHGELLLLLPFPFK